MCAATPGNRMNGVSEHPTHCLENYASVSRWGSRYDGLPNSNVHGANMGPIWGRQDPGGTPRWLHEFCYLGWPSVSPDMKPVEHVWDHAMCHIRFYENPPATMPGMCQALRYERDTMPQAVIDRLIDSRPCQLVTPSAGILLFSSVDYRILHRNSFLCLQVKCH